MERTRLARRFYLAVEIDFKYIRTLEEQVALTNPASSSVSATGAENLSPEA